MQLNPALAKQIATKANQVLKRDINIAELSGQLLAGSIAHQGFIPEALSVAQTGHPITGEFLDRQTKWWPFVYEDQTIAVFGLPVEGGPITQEAMTLLQGLAEVIVYQHFLLDKIQSAERVRADFIRHAREGGPRHARSDPNTDAIVAQQVGETTQRGI